MDKIILDGEITFTYPKLPALTRRIAKFADGQVRMWSETWDRWVVLRPMINRMDTFKIIWH
jgi:hypothetical protein